MFLASCNIFGLFGDFYYRANYPELWSATLGMVPGLSGFLGGVTGGLSPSIEVVEVDSFGRVMFLYTEYFASVGSGSRRMMVVQIVEENYVYFYPHYNHIIYPLEHLRGGRRIAREQLQMANSWNQEMSDASEFDRVEISRIRDRGPIPSTVLLETYSIIFPNTETRYEGLAAGMVFLRTDRYGRAVYLAVGSGSEWIGVYFAVVFNSDHTFDLETSVVEMVGDDYQTDLRLLMEANGWNTPP
jgi:hypothetical protein